MSATFVVWLMAALSEVSNLMYHHLSFREIQDDAAGLEYTHVAHI